MNTDNEMDPNTNDTTTVDWKPLDPTKQGTTTSSKNYAKNGQAQTILGVSSLNQIKNISGKMGGSANKSLMDNNTSWSTVQIYPGQWLCYKYSATDNITKMILITFELVNKNSRLQISNIEAGKNTGQWMTTQTLTIAWKNRSKVNLATSDTEGDYGIFDLQLEIDTYNTLIDNWNENEDKFIEEGQSQKLSMSTQLSQITNISGLCGGAYMAEVQGQNWFTFKDTDTDSIWYCYIYDGTFTKMLQITFALTNGAVTISNIVAKYERGDKTSSQQSIKTAFQNGSSTTDNNPPYGVATSKTENGYGLYNLQIQIGDTLLPPVPSPDPKDTFLIYYNPPESSEKNYLKYNPGSDGSGGGGINIPTPPSLESTSNKEDAAQFYLVDTGVYYPPDSTSEIIRYLTIISNPKLSSENIVTFQINRGVASVLPFKGFEYYSDYSKENNQSLKETMTGGYTLNVNNGESMGSSSVFSSSNMMGTSDYTLYKEAVSSPPVITIPPPNPLTIDKGSTFTAPTATTNDGSKVSVKSNNVDTSKTGSYSVVYSATNSAGTNTATLIVDVTDTLLNSPIITIPGPNPLFIFKGSTFTAPTATTNDGSTISVSGQINTSKTGSYNVVYSATNSAGTNTATLIVNVQLNVFGISPPTTSEFYQGSIIMWNNDKPPPGWYICDGGKYNGIQTPDLSGRFIVGAGQYESSDYTLGKTGGEEKVKLTIDKMPKHSHTISYSRQNSETAEQDRYRITKLTESQESPTYTSSSTGGEGDHENRPPYYVLSYIMFCGYGDPNQDPNFAADAPASDAASADAAKIAQAAADAAKAAAEKAKAAQVVAEKVADEKKAAVEQAVAAAAAEKKAALEQAAAAAAATTAAFSIASSAAAADKAKAGQVVGEKVAAEKKAAAAAAATADKNAAAVEKAKKEQAAAVAAAADAKAAAEQAAAEQAAAEKVADEKKAAAEQARQKAIASEAAAANAGGV